MGRIKGILLFNLERACKPRHKILSWFFYYMWIYFNRDHEDNKRRDLIHLTDEEYANELVVKKIAQEIKNPHELHENLIKKIKHN